MVENNKKELPTKAAPLVNKEYTLNLSNAPRMVERVVGLVIEAPKEWPLETRRMFVSMEKSLLNDPKFRHLSVLPPGSLQTLVTLEPAAQAA